MDAAREAADREHGSGGASALARTLGYRLSAWERDRAVVTYDLNPDHANRHGNLHGGVVATLMDAAGGYCGLWSEDPARRRHSVTLTLTVEYIANPGAAGAVSVEARRTGGGRTIYFMRAEARDAAGTLLATGHGTFRYVTRTE